jgi:hypothetical protein
MNVFSLAGGAQAPLDTLVASLNASFKNRKSEFGDHMIKGMVMAVEGLDDTTQANLRASLGSLKTMIVESFSEVENNLNLGHLGDVEAKDANGTTIKSDTAGLNENQLRAATAVAMAFSDPEAYALAATNTATPSGAQAVTMASEGLGGQLQHFSKSVMAQEAFSEQPLRQMMGWSVTLAAANARQDAFAEAWFPTTVLTPADAGLTLSIARSMIVNTPIHELNGAPNNLNRVNLIDAARNPEILEDESTRIIPVVPQDTNSPIRDFLIADFGIQNVDIDGFKVPTAPLKFGAVGLINVSTPSHLAQAGVMDLTDAIGQGARLEYLVGKLGDDYLRINVRNLATSGFLPAQEGEAPRQVLSFVAQDLPIHAGTRTVSGAVIDWPEVVNNELTIRYAVDVTGSLDLQTTEARVNGAIIGISAVLDKDGNEISLEDGIGKTVADKFKADFKLEGWYPFAVRTNENRRQLGKLLDVLEQRYCYGIPLTAPISVPAPVGSNKPAQNLEALISAQRRRCSNAAITTLINHAGLLADYMAGKRRKGTMPQLGSIGRLVVHPFYEKRVIDAAAAVQTLRDNDKALDIAALLTNTIKDLAADMLIQSAYPAALEASLTGSKSVKLLVGTDIKIGQHLQVVGDLRTFGPMFSNMTVVTTLNKKMDNRVFLTLTRDSESNVPDVLQFGWHAFMPELVSVVQVTRHGNTRQEATVQSRYLHICNLPILAEIEVKNLSQALYNKSAMRVELTQESEFPVVPGDGTDPDAGGTAGGAGTGSGTQPGA